MSACWSCGEAPGPDAFCQACGKVQPPHGEDPFAILGLPRVYAIDSEDLERRFRDLQRKLHPDRFARASAPERRASLQRATSANEAMRLLRDPVRRAEALMRLAGVAPPAEGTPESRAADPELLMEILELRESLEEAKHAGDATRIEELGRSVRTRRDATLSAIGTALDEGRAADALPLVGQLRYFARFLDEVTAIEEAL